MELVRKNLHRNRQKGRAVSQITLDDDYNIPDSMPDVGMTIQEKGKIEMSEVKVEAGRVRVKGTLLFDVLYLCDGSEGSLWSVGGPISFEELMNIEEAAEGDNLQLKWTLEDLSVSLINSRKLSLKAIVTLELLAEELFSEEIPVEVEDAGGTQVKTCSISMASLAARKKDTCRIKDEILLPANKPNIRELIWQDVTLQGTELRLSEGQVLIKGELVVFVLYHADEEEGKACWMEQILPFHSQVEVSGCEEGMLGNIELGLAGSDLEVKPDYDGELRVLNLDAVLELDIRIYTEEQLNMICDLYHPTRNLELLTEPSVYENLLLCSGSRCRVSGRLMGNPEMQILQLCHSRGEVRIDAVTMEEQAILVEGAAAVQVLYVTADDSRPFLCLKGAVPFEHRIEVPGLTPTSVYYLQTSLEQLSVNLAGGAEAEVKAGILLNVMAFDRVSVQHITGVTELPPDLEARRAQPGFLIYVVQPADTLWDVAKACHTTIEQMGELNHLSQQEVRTGQKLLVVKEMGEL